MKAPCVNDFIDEICKNNINSVKAFSGKEKEGIFPNSLYDSIITLLPKPQEDISR